jgi:hypothetical protein
VAGAEFLGGRIVAIRDPGLRVWGRLALVRDSEAFVWPAVPGGPLFAAWRSVRGLGLPRGPRWSVAQVARGNLGCRSLTDLSFWRRVANVCLLFGSIYGAIALIVKGALS